ncbi:hypothetical protein GCM10023107_01220 [Actinoplanes octamycinicus]
MARTIARNAAVLQRIAEALLDLAGLDSGHLALEKRRVDLAALVTDAISAARSVITTDLPDTLPLPADPDRLRQVLDDLLANAVKYSRPAPPSGSPCTAPTAGPNCASPTPASAPRNPNATASSTASSAAATAATRAPTAAAWA